MHKPTILVVDDDHEIGFMLKLMLEHKGFSVIVSERADHLENIFQQHNIDLVILDMLIAGTQGTEVCIDIKKNPATAHLPVLMITALPEAEYVCREAGANDFVAKPFEMQVLISKIHHMMNTSKQPT